MTFFAALLIALAALFNTGAQAPLTVPSQALTYEAPQVDTAPAPKALTQAPTQALTQPLYKAPVQAPTQAPLKAPTQAPLTAPICYEDMPCWDCSTMGNLICGNEAPQPTAAQCEEDMPCWDCATMGNKICGPTKAPVATTTAPKVDPYSGNPIVDCAALGFLTAEDFSCVAVDYYPTTNE